MATAAKICQFINENINKNTYSAFAFGTISASIIIYVQFWYS